MALTKITVPCVGFFPDLEAMYVLNEKDGKLAKWESGKYLRRADRLPEVEQDFLRGSRFHTVTLNDTSKRKLFENCSMIVKFTPFTEVQIKQVAALLKTIGYKIVLTDPDIVSGSVSKILVSDRDVIADIVNTQGISEEYTALPAKKRLAYTGLIYGENRPFMTPDDRPLKVTIIDGDSSGRGWMTSELADLNGIKGGVCKLGGPSKEVALVNDTICKIYGSDLVISEGANKLKLSEEKFAALVGHRPSCHPLTRFNKKAPSLKVDVLVAQDMISKPELDDIRECLKTGKASTELALSLALARDKDGTSKLINYLKPLFVGANLFAPKWRNTVIRALTTLIWKRFYERVPGDIGTLCDIREIPDSVHRTEGVVFLFPNQRPVLTKLAVWKETGLIGIPRDVLDKEGRDLDGDIVIAVSKHCLKWCIRPQDHELVLPEKGTDKDDLSDFDVWAKIIDTRRAIGKVHNDSGVLISLAVRKQWNLYGIIELVSEMVHMDELYIHGFKHGFNEEIPNLYVRGLKKGFTKKELKREQYFSRKVRNGTLIDWIEASEHASPDAPAYERIAHMFKDWTINQSVDSLDPYFDKVRRSSFMHMRERTNKPDGYTSADIAERYNYAVGMMKRKDNGTLKASRLRGLIITCFAKKDYTFGNFAFKQYAEFKAKKDDAWKQVLEALKYEEV